MESFGIDRNFHAKSQVSVFWVLGEKFAWVAQGYILKGKIASPGEKICPCPVKREFFLL